MCSRRCAAGLSSRPRYARAPHRMSIAVAWRRRRTAHRGSGAVRQEPRCRRRRFADRPAKCPQHGSAWPAPRAQPPDRKRRRKLQCGCQARPALAALSHTRANARRGHAPTRHFPSRAPPRARTGDQETGEPVPSACRPRKNHSALRAASAGRCSLSIAENVILPCISHPAPIETDRAIALSSQGRAGSDPSSDIIPKLHPKRSPRSGYRRGGGIGVQRSAAVPEDGGGFFPPR